MATTGPPHPPHLVVVVLMTLVVYGTSGARIPKLEFLEREDNRIPKEEQEESDKRDSDQQPMVLIKTTDDNEPVVIEIAYNDDGQSSKGDDPNRYSYNIVVDDARDNGQFLDRSKSVDKSVTYDNAEESPAIVIKSSDGNQGTSEENDMADSVIKGLAYFEENSPGFPNWPKHMPEHLRPIPPFPDYEGPLSLGGRDFFSERTNKRDEAFMPNEKYPPPSRAGPYLYPQSIVDRDFRVPFL